MESEYQVRTKIGTIIGGSFEQGLQVKLDPAIATEELPVDSFAVVQGAGTVYFCIVTNLSIQSSANQIQWSALDISNPSISSLL